MEEYLSALVNWSRLKFRIHNKSNETIVYFQEREIWWASLGINIGSEQNGKHGNFERPVLVLKKFNKYTLWIIPITSKYKSQKYYFNLFIQGILYCFNVSQIRLISSKRLLRKMVIIPEKQFREIQESIKRLM